MESVNGKLVLGTTNCAGATIVFGSFIPVDCKTWKNYRMSQNFKKRKMRLMVCEKFRIKDEPEA